MVWTQPRLMEAGSAKATSPESAQQGPRRPKTQAASYEKETTSSRGDGSGVLHSLLCAHLDPKTKN